MENYYDIDFHMCLKLYLNTIVSNINHIYKKSNIIHKTGSNKIIMTETNLYKKQLSSIIYLLCIIYHHPSIIDNLSTIIFQL